ncbi:MAG: glycosyltransferase family 9 protein [Syntrophobacteria bacterium]
MNVLIVKLSALGDVIQAIPTFEALRRQYPRAHIGWLVEEEAADILRYYPGLDELLVCPRRRWLGGLRAARPGAATDFLRFCRLLRRRRYDAVVDLQGLLKSGLWVALARGTRKIGFNGAREASWKFLNERLPSYDPNRHALERYLDVARYLGAEAGRTSIRDLWNRAEGAQIKRRLARITRETRRLVVCHPMSRWPTKLWPEDRFAHLARKIAEDLKASVVFTGGAADRGKVSRIIYQAGCQEIFNWAGTTNLRELAYLYKHAALVIAVDSGPMHLAALLGTQVVALFGPTAPWRTGPYGEGHTVLWAGLDCSPCFQKSCNTMQCMAAITVKDVMEAVAGQLEKE